jgi:deoxyadenosine/deoxycytidine kinase
MYILEGNIGVGKSTFLQLVKQLDVSIDTILEPQENWANKVFGQSLLANFYQDPHRWAYTLETLAMVCRARDHLQEQVNPFPRRIFERSIYSGHYCFAYNDRQNGYLNEIEWYMYNTWADFFLKQQCRPPLGFIYLKADPDVCYKRVQKRSRSSEINLTLEYMKQIDQWHEQFLIEKQDVFDNLKNIPVLVIDCNQNFEQDKQLMRSHLEKIQTFFSGTHNSDARVQQSLTFE